MKGTYRLSIILAAIAGVILGTCVTVIVDHTTFDHQILPPSGNITHYLSLPSDMYQAKKGDIMYMNTKGDTLDVQFYHTDPHTNQGNLENIRILTDSMFYTCPPSLIMEELNAH